MYTNASADTKLGFTFDGTAVGVDMYTCGACAPADFYIDGELKGSKTLTGGDGVTRAFDIAGLPRGTHTLEIRTHATENGLARVEGIDYRHLADPTAPSFTTQDTLFDVQPGDELSIRIDRNAAAGTRFGQYAITFPTGGWLLWNGTTWSDATTQAFATNGVTDTVKVKVPADYTLKGGHITITPTAADGVYAPISVTVNAPDAPEAPAITGPGEIRTVDRTSYPYESTTGEASGGWTSFDHSTQADDYFTFDGGWWSDDWAWMYTQASVDQSLGFTFEGDAVALYARLVEGGGSFDVYIDGEKKGSVSTAGAAGTRRVFSASGLPVGVHSVELRLTSEGVVAVDGFDYDYMPAADARTVAVNTTTHPFRARDGGTSGNWAAFDPASQSKTYFVTDGGWWSDGWAWMYDPAGAGNDGQKVDFTFSGTSVSVLGRTSPKTGILDAYIDGAYQGRIDTKRDGDLRTGVELFGRAGLARGTHTLRLVVVGDASRDIVAIDEFRYTDDPQAAPSGFSAPTTVPLPGVGEKVRITVARDANARALSGTYDVSLPAGWLLESGASFSAGSATDEIVLLPPAVPTAQQNAIAITPVVGDQRLLSLAVSTVRQTGALPDLVTLTSPAYRADIAGDTTLDLVVPGGYASIEAFSTHQPDAQHPATTGYAAKFATADLDGDGKASIVFPAADFPHGPVAVKVVASKADGSKTITDYFQFFNTSGVSWDVGLDAATLPADAQGRGLEVAFEDDFTSMPSISATGTDANGQHTTYTSHKPDYQDYGEALFAPHEGNYDPFEQVEDYLKIVTTKHDEPLPADVDGYRRDFTTGFLSSIGDDGVGFRTKGYTEQYFETRFFVGANPAQWPAFWTLTGLGSPINDELDINEGYPPANGYQIATHQWGYSTGLGGGKKVETIGLQGPTGDIQAGFHTYAVHIAEDETTYYFDNTEVFREKTLPLSWRNGNYFLLNNAVTGAKNYPEGYGFERYGDQSDMYIDWVRVYEQPNRPEVIFDKTALGSIDVAPGTDVSIGIDRVTDGAKSLAGTYDVTLPSGWTIVSGAAFAAGSAHDTLVVHVPEGYVKTKADVTITPVAADGTRFAAIVQPTVNTDDSLGVEIIPVRDAGSGAWSLKATLTNRSETVTFPAGTIAVEAPEALAGDVAFGSLAPGAHERVLIPAGALAPDAKTAFTLHVTRSDGFDRTIERVATGLQVPRVDAQHPIEIDGAVDASDWGAPAFHLGEGQSVSTTGAPWTAADRSVDASLRWDDDHLYVAVQVTDDVAHSTWSSVGDSWGTDSLQLSFDPKRPGGYTANDADHPRFIAALNSETGQSGLGVETWGPVTTGDLSAITYAFSRDESRHVTTYEIAFPWTALLTEDRLPAAADVTDLGFSFLVNDNDGSGREGWLEYMGGIGFGKDPSLFGDLTLTAGTTVPTPTPTPTPTATPTDNPTGTPTGGPTGSPTGSPTGRPSPTVPGGPGGIPLPPALADLLAALENLIRAIIDAIVPGQPFSVFVGAQYAGQWVHGFLYSTPTSLGWHQVSPDGYITLTVPEGTPAGEHRLVIVDADGDVIGWQRVTVTALATTGGQLSPTLLIGGVLLLAVGAGLVVRRRRQVGRGDGAVPLD